LDLEVYRSRDPSADEMEDTGRPKNAPKVMPFKKKIETKNWNQGRWSRRTPVKAWSKKDLVISRKRRTSLRERFRTTKAMEYLNEPRYFQEEKKLKEVG